VKDPAKFSRALSRGLTKKSAGPIGRTMLPGKLAHPCALTPGGLSLGSEDALTGVRPSNRRRMVGGALGGKMPVGSPGSRGFGGGRLFRGR
jgi:hypothetical protein